jgi:hypothetical protein
MIMRLAAMAFLSMLAATLALPASAQSEETAVSASAVVRGKGTGFRIGEKLGTYVGVLEGPLYVEGSEGPVRAGMLVCSATMEIKAEDRSHSGTGRCLLTSDEGGEVFGQFTCTGFFLVGCSGPFTLTGGTGRFAGITGGGPMTMRTSVGKLGGGTATTQNVEVEGIVFWRELKYKLP